MLLQWTNTKVTFRSLTSDGVIIIIIILFPSFQINPGSENDFGSYNCTASNELGTESKEFLLIQAGQRLCLLHCPLRMPLNVCLVSQM